MCARNNGWSSSRDDWTPIMLRLSDNYRRIWVQGARKYRLPDMSSWTMTFRTVRPMHNTRRTSFCVLGAQMKASMPFEDLSPQPVWPLFRWKKRTTKVKPNPSSTDDMAHSSCLNVTLPLCVTLPWKCPFVVRNQKGNLTKKQVFS